MLFIGHERNRTRFIFKLYDIDNDGILDGNDIVTF